MESTESHEPSYYEVALTNRQVLIAFVVLLSCLVTAFLSGVWIGRGGSSTARNPPATLEAAAASLEPPLEQLTFFNGKEPGSRTAGAAGSAAAGAAPAVPAAADPVAPPSASAPTTAEERATETMRQNLDATMAANRTIPAPAAAPPPATTRPAAPTPAAAAPTAAVAPAKPATAAKKEPAVAKPAVAGKTFVQVYSSNNGTRAREIVAQLRKGGFTVVMTETPKGGGTNYRVRVGPYAERSKAEAAATRLRRDFRLETWVTDSP